MAPQFLNLLMGRQKTTSGKNAANGTNKAGDAYIAKHHHSHKTAHNSYDYQCNSNSSHKNTSQLCAIIS